MVSISQTNPNFITYGQLSIINDFRKLWAEFAMWMKVYIISIDNNSRDIPAISERLYRVPKDFYSKLEVFFGPVLSQQLYTLLMKYIVTCMQLTISTKNGNRQIVDANTAEWYRNAEELSNFLAQITFAWNKGQWDNLFFQYMSMAIQEMVARFSGDYNMQTSVNDRIMIHALMMADYMANGIIHHITLRDIETPDTTDTNSSPKNTDQLNKHLKNQDEYIYYAMP